MSAPIRLPSSSIVQKSVEKREVVHTYEKVFLGLRDRQTPLSGFWASMAHLAPYTNTGSHISGVYGRPPASRYGTEAGVQAFHYRHAERVSTGGRTLVIHPDELHDGHAREAAGFAYGMRWDRRRACSCRGRRRRRLRRSESYGAAFQSPLRHYPRPIREIAEKRSNGSTRVVKPPSHLRRQCRH
jgi:hypothetical protein